MVCFGLDRNGKGRIGISANLSAAPPLCALSSAMRCTATRAHVRPPRRPAGSRNSGAMIKFLIATENYFQIKALLRFCVRARAIMRSDNWHERNRISALSALTSECCTYSTEQYTMYSDSERIEYFTSRAIKRVEQFILLLPSALLWTFGGPSGGTRSANAHARAASSATRRASWPLRCHRVQ